jgi:hypothetical protein
MAHLSFLCVLLLGALSDSHGFHVQITPSPSCVHQTLSAPSMRQSFISRLHSSSNDNGNSKEENEAPQTQEEKAKAVGNLVENDEWLGLTMELSELIRTAVIEDIKTNAREFLGKDNYQVGDISKEIDSRVKSEVARMRGKEVCTEILAESNSNLV